MNKASFIPYTLIFIRLLLAPLIVLLAYFHGENRTWLVVLMTFGLLTDIFDGIIARQTNSASEKMRRMDSQVDLVFWLGVAYSSWILEADLLRNYLPVIFSIFLMELACYAISLIKFKRETCTHAYLSKLFGLAMFAAFFNLIGFGQGGLTLFIAVAIGLLSHIDRILITLILPRWTFDVPSFYHAYQIRKGRSIKKHKLFN